MDSRSIDALVLALGVQRGGALSTADLLRAGLDHSGIRRREGRLLTRVASGVYVVGPVTHLNLLAAALVLVPDAALSHSSAAGIHRLAVAKSNVHQNRTAIGTPRIEVLSRRRTRRRVDGVRIRTTSWLPDEDLALVDHRRVTSAARTICDLASSMRGRRLEHVVESAVISRATSAPQMQACLLSFCRRGRAGSALLRRTAMPLLDTESVPESALERLTSALLESESIEGWLPQFVPTWHDGIRGTVDFAWPEQRVLLEVDGRRWHSVTQAFDEDRRRDQATLAAGWWPIRAGWQQVTERPGELAAVIRTALERSVRNG